MDPARVKSLSGEPIMSSRRLQVVIPEDHELVVQVPEDVPAGPAELIVFTPREEPVERAPEEAVQKFHEVVDRLAADPRPFHDLSDEEKNARLNLILGMGRGLFSSSEERARRKQEEIDLEERRFAR
jgi:hypothetical protein